MQPRVIALVLALIVAAIVLFFFLWGGDDTKHENATSGATGAASQEKVTGTGGGVGSVGAPRPRPRGGDGTSSAARSGANPDDTRTYVTDTGNLVRDHRSNVTDPKAVPAPLPPEQRTMNSAIAAEIYRSLAPTVRGCASDIDASAKGPSPVVNVTLSVDIAGEKLTTMEATAVVSDISGPAADKVIACVRDRAAGLTVDAKGEPDRGNYVVQYPIRIR